jgi:hypothetical protein
VVAHYVFERTIANSVLPTIDWSAEQPVLASYRNPHVFVRRDGGWECVAWQVTQIQV